MSCSFYVVILKIFAVILQIYQVGGECSTEEWEVCRLTGRFCSNNGECYDPNFSQDIVLERLEDCDPINDPVCKKNIEDIRNQLASELTGSYNRKKIDLSSLKLTKSTDETTNGQKDNPVTESKLRKETKLREKLLINDENADRKPSGDVDADSMETLNGSDTNYLSKKSPVDNDSDDDDEEEAEIPDVYFIIIIIACTLSGVAGIALSGYCWYKLHNNDEKISKSEYIPGVRKTNVKSIPSKNGDRKLDYKAEMYHYVHTKSQIAAMEKAKSDHLGSEGLSHDEDDDVEDYTVYECPGLAPTGDMTVVNPLFSDQEVTGSDECRTHSNRSSPNTSARSTHSPQR